MRNLLHGLLILILAGCASAEVQPQSLWGRVHTLTETEQSHAPALWVQPDGALTAGWIGADDAGVHQDARMMKGGALGSTVTLPLPPVYPFDQTLLPAADGKLHLLWQDASTNGDLRLYAALLTPDLTIQRGPTLVSDNLTLRYAAVAQADGSVLVVWSGGLPAEPALYLQRIDERGLPRMPVRLAHNADWPTLVQANDGTLYVFWRQASDGSLHGGQLQDDQFTNSEVVESALILERGDRLQQLQAALDSTHVYLFWNLTQAAGDDQAWMMARPLDSPEWSTPNRVGVGDAQETPLQTGFNTGTVVSAQAGDQYLEWAAPMPGQFDVLPVAGQFGDDLTVIYLQAGGVAGYQLITSVGALIGPPVLLPDRDRYLYLAWAEPLQTGHAMLKLTSSRG